MGTETYLKMMKLSAELHIEVKLNNPLMGTETLFFVSHSKLLYFLWLN